STSLQCLRERGTRPIPVPLNEPATLIPRDHAVVDDGCQGRIAHKEACEQCTDDEVCVLAGLQRGSHTKHFVKSIQGVPNSLAERHAGRGSSKPILATNASDKNWRFH